jgi:hypothetical protein
MPTQKTSPSIGTCLSLWNLLIILLGVAAVLLFRPFIQGP